MAYLELSNHNLLVVPWPVWVYPLTTTQDKEEFLQLRFRVSHMSEYKDKYVKQY